jgi:transposase
VSTTMRRRRKFTKEFKDQAVRHLMKSDKSLKEVATGLDVDRSLLGVWRRQYIAKADAAVSPGSDEMKPSEMDAEMRRLRKELSDMKEQRDILKKAVRIFSRDPNTYLDS